MLYLDMHYLPILYNTHLHALVTTIPDSVLHRHARDNKLIVVMAGMTFCSACKSFVPSYLV